MKLPSLYQIAKGTARYIEYNDRTLWYDLDWHEDDPPFVAQTFRFPIPIDDAGEGSFTPEMKGVNVLRWARKHVDAVKAAKLEQGPQEL